MRILVDYRPALRTRTGAGEYIHEIIRAYTAAFADPVTVFTSSWKDRPDPRLSAQLGAHCIDRRIPVRLLNLLWHRAEWPPVEWVAGAADVVHAPHPLLIPSRRAAQVVTIHDLFFLTDPARTRGEVRRDYPVLVDAHARRADAIITSSRHTAGLIAGRLQVDPGRIYLCPPGAPSWPPAAGPATDGYVLFVGTLEPRKNVGGLLDAYARLLARWPEAPDLVLAGAAPADAAPLLARLHEPPLGGRVRHLGYIPDDQRQAVYKGAAVLVLPSFDEGFGMPVLEAMTLGIPVVASTAGALPEVVGEAGLLCDPHDAGGLAAAIERLVRDPAAAAACARAGRARAGAFSWERSARTLRQAYEEAVERRRGR